MLQCKSTLEILQVVLTSDGTDLLKSNFSIPLVVVKLPEISCPTDTTLPSGGNSNRYLKPTVSRSGKFLALTTAKLQSRSYSPKNPITTLSLWHTLTYNGKEKEW